jgi:zinc transport system substrate-binding protein
VRKIFLVSLIITLLFTGCGKNVTNNNKIKAAATIFPIYDALKEIGGDRVDAILIIPSTSDPHNFSLSPQDIEKLQGVSIVFENGIGLETWMSELIQNLGNSELIDTSKQIAGDVIEGNPHVWLNPDYFIQQCATIEKALAQVDPANSMYFENNFNVYTGSIKTEAENLRKETEKLPVKKIISFHNAFPYFAQYFGLEVIGTIENTPGALPTPQQIKNIEDLIVKDNIKAIFKEPQQSAEIMNAMIEDTHVKVYVLDPIGGISSRNSYLETMRYNVNTVMDALK